MKNKTKKELIQLAKIENIKGISKLNKEELLKVLENHFQNTAEQKKRQPDNSELNNPRLEFWKTYVDGVFRVILVIIVSVLTIYTFAQNCKSSQSSKSETILESKQSSNDSLFNIVILPLHPDKDCIIEKTDYERKLIERFDEVKSSQKLKIDVRLNRNYSCPRGIERVKEIAIKESADFIIWGYYDEECESESKVRLKYYYVNKVGLDIDNFGDTGFREIQNFSEFKNDFLFTGIDYLIKYVLSYYEYANYNLLESINLLNSIEREDCDTLILENLLHNYFEITDYQNSGRVANLLLNCNSSSKKGLFYKGVISKYKKEFSTAINYFSDLIKNDSLNYKVLANRIEVYIDNQEYDNAMKDINYIISKKGETFGTLFFRSKIYENTGKYDDALEDLQIIIDRYGGENNFDVILSLIDTHFKKGNKEDSFYWTEVLFEKFPERETSYARKIGKLLLTEEFEEAYKYLEIALVKFPKNKFFIETKKHVF